MTWWLVALVVGVLAVGLARQVRSRDRPQPVDQRPVALRDAPADRPLPALDHVGHVDPADPPRANTEPSPPPPAIASLALLRAADLSPEQRDQLVAALGRFPPPPQALQRLSSPEMLASASSAEIAKLVAAEPQIAAKVLATVNSAFYGLRAPVDGIGHAITFLGLNTVRSIALKQMLATSLQTTDASQARAIERIWLASSLASELCARSAQHLRLPDHASLVTQVMLSFVGHLAAALLQPADAAATDLARPLAERVDATQGAVGLPPSEIGALLTQAWELPERIVDSVAEIDRVLVTPASAAGTAAAGTALCYLCARLGERLAAGTLRELADFDPAAADIDLFHLRGYLDAAPLAGVVDYLRSAALATGMRHMLSTVQPSA